MLRQSPSSVYCGHHVCLLLQYAKTSSPDVGRKHTPLICPTVGRGEGVWTEQQGSFRRYALHDQMLQLVSLASWFRLATGRLAPHTRTGIVPQERGPESFVPILYP
jgi:hypothetical protein